MNKMNKALAEQSRIAQIALEHCRFNPYDEQAEEDYFTEKAKLDTAWLNYVTGEDA